MKPEQIKCRYCARWDMYTGWCMQHKWETGRDEKCLYFVREPGADDDIDEDEE